MIQIGHILSSSARPFRSLIGIFLLSILLQLTACTSLLQPQPSPQTYMLDASIDPPPIIRTSNHVLLVEMPRTEPGFDTPYIAYTDAPLALDYYTQSEWADTPSRMLLPLVVRAMENTGAFSAVLVPPTTVPGNLRLNIDIIRLQQEFMDQPSQVRLTLRAKLIDIQNNAILDSQHFEVVEPAPSENAYGGVQAANRAVEQILRDLAAFVMLHVDNAVHDS